MPYGWTLNAPKKLARWASLASRAPTGEMATVDVSQDGNSCFSFVTRVPAITNPRRRYALATLSKASTSSNHFAAPEYCRPISATDSDLPWKPFKSHKLLLFFFLFSILRFVMEWWSLSQMIRSNK